MAMTSPLPRVVMVVAQYPPVVAGTERACQNLARALEARAFGARGVRRSYLADIAFRPLDWVYLLLIALVAAALLFLHFRLGFGADPLRLLP